jgi:hypothetical protein
MKQAEAVWALAVLGTASTREVAMLLEGKEDTPVNDASHVLFQLYKQGLVVRRKTPTSDTEYKHSSYEYAIATPETHSEYENGYVDTSEAEA